MKHTDLAPDVLVNCRYKCGMAVSNDRAASVSWADVAAWEVVSPTAIPLGHMARGNIAENEAWWLRQMSAREQYNREGGVAQIMVEPDE